MQEILDLVDDNDQVIGTVDRKIFQTDAQPQKGNIRVSDGFIVNNQGQLWIPRRTADKKIAPSGLDFSVAEHVQSGETYVEAMVRGFAEEVNIILQTQDLELQKIIAPTRLPLFRAIFIYRTDKTPIYNPADFTGYEWLLPQEVCDRIAAGDTAKSNLASTIQDIFMC